VKVHQHDPREFVHLELRKLGQRLAPIGSFTNDLDVGLGGKEADEPATDDLVVVDDQNADHGVGLLAHD
jgi:hypothetical protein